METDFLQNFVLIAEEKSIAKAADRLFISRSALNRQLLQAEKELGIPLFKRTSKSLELTYAGSIYLETANSILSTLKRSELQFSEIRNDIRGQITFGASSSICTDVICAIFKAFHERYPGIKLIPVQENSTTLANMLQKGTLDFAIISSVDANPDLHTRSLLTSEVLMYVPKNHPMACRAGRSPDGQYLPCNLQWFRNDAFCMQGHDSPLYEILGDLFRKASFVPNVVLGNCTRSISVELVEQGIACAILADFFPDENLNAVKFGLAPRLYYSLALAFPKGYVPSAAESYFIDLISQYYKGQQA